MIPVPHPSALEVMAIHEPGLTAGSTYYRLFEAGLEMDWAHCASIGWAYIPGAKRRK